jgi:endonuclease-3
MTKKEKEKALEDFLYSLYPQTETFLKADCEYRFLIAVILSAQAQDRVVNQVTPVLFKKYRTLDDLAAAQEKDVLSIIRSVGLGPSKAKNIVALAKTLKCDYRSQVPHDREVLKTLPGVGHKTAGVFLGEIDHCQVIPVDTHISRIACRLGLAEEGSEPGKIEAILEKNFQGTDMMNFHREMILFGRNICLASAKRKCCLCPLSFCRQRLKDDKKDTE